MSDYDSVAPKPAAIFRELHLKFGDNSARCIRTGSPALQIAEVKARATYQLGQELLKDPSLAPFRKLLVDVLGEVFSDMIVSLYLAGCALDNPAKILGRRVLELGIAVVYLWDQPSRFYAWYKHDKDLSFQEMSDYIGSKSFDSFICDELNGKPTFDVATANDLYGELSDIIHGKMTTFESSVEDRFSHSSKDWELYLQMILGVQDFLLRLWQARFPQEFNALHKVFAGISSAL
jgi:hypothetical protein